MFLVLKNDDLIISSQVHTSFLVRTLSPILKELGSFENQKICENLRTHNQLIIFQHQKHQYSPNGASKPYLGSKKDLMFFFCFICTTADEHDL